MKKKEQYYSIHLLSSGNTDDLSHAINYELFGADYENDEKEYPSRIDLRRENKKENWFVDSSPINIDSLLNILQTLKQAGANYVSIDYHIDHNEYEFSALQIINSTPEEITTEKMAVEKTKAREKRIKELRTEIQNISNEK